MSRLLSQFLERLAERFAALMAGVISSRVEGLQAVAQAEQQSHLEDLARRYDAEGKPEIAATLRKRALSLTSSDLAAQAVEVMQLTTGEVPRLEAPSTTLASALPALPEMAAPEAKVRKKPVKSIATSQPAASPVENFLPSLPKPSGESS